MADPIVHVEQIAFRFSGAPRAVALAHQNGVVIGQPEWKRDVQSEPVAYVRPSSGRTIKIKTVFSCSDPAIRSVRVRARRTGPSGFFGDVGEVTVRFTSGRSRVTACRVSCSTFRGVALEAVSWQWQYKIADRWISTNHSDHEIALVLARPEKPWKATRPWWEVMRLACDAARGSTTRAAAASKIAETVFRVWGSAFYTYDEGQHYASDVGVSPPRFDCGRFLGLLNGGDEDATVDCSDVAAIASTFAAILGCRLSQLAIDMNDPTKVVRLVGQSQWMSQDFTLHELAVSGAVYRTLGSRPRIWDACMEVSGDRSIGATGPPYEALLPTGLTQTEYLSRVLGLRRGRLKALINEKPLVRTVGPLPSTIRSAVIEKHLVRIADKYKFDDWKDPTQTAQVLRFVLPDLPGWELIRPVMDQEAPQPGFEKVVRLLWRRTVGPKKLIAAEVYVCATAAAARRRLVAVLGRFSGATLVPLQSVLPEIQSSASVNQEMQFATRDGTAIVASYLNIVVVVRRATTGESMIPDVRAFFQAIGTQLQTATQPLARVRARSSTEPASTPRGRRRPGRHQR